MASTGIPIPGNLPIDWDSLLRTLQAGTTITFYPDTPGGGSVIITTVDELIEYARTLGVEPIYAIRHEIVGWGSVQPVDPTSSTDLTLRAATDIVAGGAGGAVSQFVTSGNRTLGLVTKLVAVSAVMSLLISEIGAGLVPDEIKTDLITSADPYTVDGEHVPVLIDENGKTHYENDFIEAVRAKAAELGIFSNGGGFQPAPDLSSNISYTSEQSGNTNTVTVLKDNYNNYKQFTNVSNYMPLYANSQRTAGVKLEDIRQAGVYYNIEKVLFSVFSRTNTHYGINIAIICDGNIPAESGGVWFFVDANNTRITTVGATPFRYTMTVNGVTKQVKGFTYSTSIVKNAFDGTEIVGSSESTIPNPSSLLYDYLFGTPIPSVEGITPNPNTASDMADLTKPLTDILPQLAQGEMSTPSPTDEDLEDKTKWYPINTNFTDIFDQGATTTDTDPSTVTDGDVSDDNKDDIIDALRDLIKELQQEQTDPDVPTPDKPDYPYVVVEDSGDTPPENPPLVNGSANGLWKIYNPLEADIQSFGSWLWSSNIIDQITRMFNSPIDAVIALHQIYCTPVRGSSANIKCGYLDSGVASTYTVANQYQTIDCGDVEIGEFYRTAVDYEATKIELYLPFIGIVPLSASVVMGSTLNVTYRIDVLTGTCLAQVKVSKQNSNAVMYTFAGNCACQIPLTATTYTGTVSALVNSVQAGLSFMMGDIITGAGEVASAIRGGVSGLSGTKKSGSLGANAGALGIRIPYVIITHPTVYDAYLYNEQYGYPSNKTVTLGSVSGYTRVKDIHLSSIPCTDDELEMIESLLKEGVIIN